MIRKFGIPLAGLMLLTGYALAADKEVTGKIVKVDTATGIITVQTAEGKMEYKTNKDVKVVDAKGKAAKEGLESRSLAAGAEVILVIPATGKNVKEIQLAASKEKDDVPGTMAKVVSVDAAKRTAVVEMDGGKKVTITLPEETKFIGPRGGVSDKGIKDDRFVAGAEVKIVHDVSGKKVAEIRLGYRPREEKEAPKDKAPKDKAPLKDKKDK